MQLTLIDWIIIAFFFAISMGIGILAAKKGGKNTENFFLSGRNMPWWLLGVSMVATTFSADTPNLVTDIVRKNGISGNWAWWAFLLTGMLTVFVYARMWRRSGILTDLEFYELRYGGKKAAFLRGFRALYLGVVFNVLIMATVLLAGIKMGSILLGLEAWQSLLFCALITTAYSTWGGLKSVLLTDFFQFLIAMAGSVWACYLIVQHPQVGGLDTLLQHPAVQPALTFLPDFSNPALYIPIFLAPLLIQWWSVWYPGAEPGGGGYIAQRILAAKDEKNAMQATLFFNVAHYALRPWPWILIALASMVVFPTLSDIQTAFPNVDPAIVKDDLAYPAMLSLLPKGILGLVIASLIAALMSTLSTHLNWGSSYITHDFYQRFVDREASPARLVAVGRIGTVILMLISTIFALFLSNALQAFEIILQIGAGTGLLFILRWFWWRINAWSELSAMLSSFVFALFLEFAWKPIGLPDLVFHQKLIISVGLTTLTWWIVTLLTQPEDSAVLTNFYQKIQPHAVGWRRFLQKEGLKSLPSGSLSREITGMIWSCTGVYAFLFGTGKIIMQEWVTGIALVLIATVCLWWVNRIMKTAFTGN